jgi:hypothetical protein
MAGGQTAWTPDPAGDSKGGPDLIAVRAVASNGVLTLGARFTRRKFDSKTTRVAWVLDTDQDAATGSRGIFGAPGVGGRVEDARYVGADAVALVVGACNMGSVQTYNSQTTKWALAELLASSVLADGFDAYVPLSSLGKSDSHISFKTLAYRFSGECPPASISLVVHDVAPDVGKPAATAQEANSALPAPQLSSPGEGAVFDTFPRKTALQWSGVSGAVGYLVQVQYKDGTDWRALVFRLTAHASSEFDFVGAQEGRWRVWGIDANGLAGASSPWLRFRYSR